MFAARHNPSKTTNPTAAEPRESGMKLYLQNHIKFNEEFSERRHMINNALCPKFKERKERNNIPLSYAGDKKLNI